MSDDTAGLNDLQHAIWSAGDYDSVALPALAEAADVGDGEVRIASEYLLVVGALP